METNRKLGAPFSMQPASMRHMAYDPTRARLILLRILEALEISGREASKLAGVSPSVMSQFLSGKNKAMGADIYANLAEALRKRTKENILVSDLLGERPYITALGRRLELVRQVFCENLPERMQLSEDDWTALITQTGLLPDEKARQVIDVTGVPRQFLDAGDPSGLGRVQVEALLRSVVSGIQPSPAADPPELEPALSPRRQTAARKRS